MAQASQAPDPFYSGENQKYLMKSVRELRSGKGQAHELIEGIEVEEKRAPQIKR